jgi:hypothetical protein
MAQWQRRSLSKFITLPSIETTENPAMTVTSLNTMGFFEGG